MVGLLLDTANKIDKGRWQVMVGVLVRGLNV